MRDATAFDTRVIDDPDAAPAIGRVSTGDLTMHIRIDGIWHRRIPTLSHTACALEIQGEFHDPRREVLEEPLCPICFTAYERSQAKEDPSCP